MLFLKSALKKYEEVNRKLKQRENELEDTNRNLEM